MTEKLTVLIDAHYLCYRAFYAMGGLKYNGGPTGVLFGIFRDILSLQDRFCTNNLVFCFDHSKGLREQEFPTYKAHRRNRVLSEEDEEALGELKGQVVLLKKTILPKLGYNNVFYAKGYEADDVIASCVYNYFWNGPANTPVVIVSADKDLFQLLLSNVTMYNPRSKEVTSRKSFKAKYGIMPTEWVYVKSIAGCDTDNVIGVQGVAEKTAIKYLNGELTGKLADRIKELVPVWQQNEKLVRLPYPGCPKFNIVDQPEMDMRNWKRVTDEYGMKSIQQKQQRGLFDVD